MLHKNIIYVQMLNIFNSNSVGYLTEEALLSFFFLNNYFWIIYLFCVHSVTITKMFSIMYIIFIITVFSDVTVWKQGARIMAKL